MKAAEHCDVRELGFTQTGDPRNLQPRCESPSPPLARELIPRAFLPAAEPMRVV